MYLFDNFLRDKFLEDIKIFLEKHNIIDNTFLLEGLVVNLTFKTNSLEIRKDFTQIYRNLYQRHLAILEILSIKQQLEPSRQVFSLLKDHILTHTIKIGWPEILNLFISHKNKELIQDPNPIRLFPTTEDQIQSPRSTPPLYILYRAPASDSEIEEDTEEESDEELEFEEEETLDIEAQTLVERHFRRN